MPHWYYRKSQGLIAGPYSDHELREYRESGTVRDTTLVWRTGWSEWTTFAKIWKTGEEPAETTMVEDSPAATPPPLPLQLEEPVAEAPLASPKYLKCSKCRDSWPEHLLFKTGRVRMCAKCLKKYDDAQWKKRNQRGESGIFAWAFKLALIGLAVGGIVILSLGFFGKLGK